MDCAKTGALIRRVRKEKRLTQKQVADQLGVCDKAVSKWERGNGCPDVSVLRQLSALLGIETDALLSGELSPHEKEAGNMKRTRFFRCPVCGNLLLATGETTPSCCGRNLEALTPQKADEAHAARVEEMDGEWNITFHHPMEKDHFINFLACVGYDRVLLVRLYPEQGGEVRIPRMSGGKVYLCCSQHGLWMV